VTLLFTFADICAPFMAWNPTRKRVEPPHSSAEPAEEYPPSPQ
jgi:hypothetical protein